LFDCAPRYAQVVTGLGFEAPTGVKQLMIRERLQGDAATDMGSLSGTAPKYDSKPLATVLIVKGFERDVCSIFRFAWL
jgi:hypothetical protein